MVFESVWVSILNKLDVLKKTVEPLNKSQLNINLRKGEVVLKNVVLKEDALTKLLNLPLKITLGHVENITVKIKWLNPLNSEPVDVCIDGLYFLVVPCAVEDITEKEKDGTQCFLKDLKNVGQDAFLEKFVNYVIKKLQMTVRNIHLRFEDTLSNHQQPVSVGVTLWELILETADQNWKPCVIRGAVPQMNKRVKLNDLEVYWNSDSKLYDGRDKKIILQQLKNDINGETKPAFTYLVAPISFVAYLILNTEPAKQDYKVPKIHLTINIDNIFATVHTVQYLEMLEMLKGFEKLKPLGSKKKKKKKRKTTNSYKGCCKTCLGHVSRFILKEMLNHRESMLAEYRDMYRHARIEYHVTRLLAHEEFLRLGMISDKTQKELDDMKEYLEQLDFKDEFVAAEGHCQNVSENQIIANMYSEKMNKLYEIIGYKENETLPKCPKEVEDETEDMVHRNIWQIKKLADCDFWFLKKERLSHPDILASEDVFLEDRIEQMNVNVPLIVVKIEGGVGQMRTPLLQIKMAIHGEVKDWSDKLAVESSLKLEVSYFNKKLAVWEPLLEPVFDQGNFRPWELQLEIRTNAEGHDEDELKPPKMNINVRSSDPLQLTLTKSSLEIITNLGKNRDFSRDDENTLPSFEQLTLQDRMDPRQNIHANREENEITVQVVNHLAVPVKIFYEDDMNSPTLITTVKPDATLCMPRNTIYTTTGNFMYSVCAPGCNGISEGVSWKDAETLDVTQIVCQGETTPQDTHFLTVRASIENVNDEAGDQLSTKITTFHLYPTVILHNMLPYKCKVIVEGTREWLDLEMGCSVALHHAGVDISSVRISIPDYLKTEWVGTRFLAKNIPELSQWTFRSNQGEKKELTMDLGVLYKNGMESKELSIYSPYWIVNKTDVNLFYKVEQDWSIEHQKNNSMMVMLSCKKKSGKKKVQLKIEEGDWSDKFSLDTVGISDTVQSRSETRTFKAGMSIELVCKGLTKVVTFTPYYVLVNKSKYPIMCKEEANTRQVVEVQNKGCVGMWPVNEGDAMEMKAMIKGSNRWTNSFPFNKPHSSLLQLDNKYGGINVDCVETDSTMVITLTNYKTGMAAVQLINNTDRCEVQYYQSGTNKFHTIKEDSVSLFTWDNVMGKKKLVWTCGEMTEQTNDLIKDGNGEFFYNSETKVFWVSFLNGMQRVLLFTNDRSVATIAQEADVNKRIEKEITVKLQEVSLSLINDYKQQEVAYLGVTSSGIIWEEANKKRYKAFSNNTSQALENAFQAYTSELAAGNVPSQRINIDEMEVNFREMLMTGTNRKKIRRSFQDGIWIEIKTSPHQVQLHTKINNVQLDNQVPGAVFQTVLSPMPPPKSVAADSVPKPFIEISLVMRTFKHSDRSHIKNVEVLIQDMQLKVDLGFLNNMLELLSADQELENDEKKDVFDRYMKRTNIDLMTIMGGSTDSEKKMFYEHLRLHPIKIYLSFSVQCGWEQEPTQIHANAINLFLKSLGVVLTDVQDVVIQLSNFERQDKVYCNSQLKHKIKTHYVIQAIKQLYALVFGLDVLGNPVGLLRGMVEGTRDLVYEPYQGAKQGRREFAEGLALGARSLFGNAMIGGAAGAVSRITGTLGKGLAALTLDDDFQKKRLEAMNKRPARVGEDFVRGGKGLVMGLYTGVNDLVRKPVEGAEKEGVKGLVKGLGKGLISVVTRPTSGAIDFASSSLAGIQRIAGNTTEIYRLRPPRRFYKDGSIHPYSLQETKGTEILRKTDSGFFYDTDEYVAHTIVTEVEKGVFLVTNKRVLFVSPGKILRQWKCRYSYVWTEMKEKPKTWDYGIELVLKEENDVEEMPSSFRKKTCVGDKKTAEWLVEKVSDAMDSAN